MRQVAHHIWIKELLDGTYEEKEGWEPNILHTARGAVSRVNVLGTMITISSRMMLDDGTGQVPLRAYDEVPGLAKAQTGTFVCIIGRPRKYGDGLYLVPEVVREIDPRWALVRKKELGEPQVHVRAPTPQPAPAVEEPIANDAERIITIITGLDKGEGADVESIIGESGIGDAAEAIINQLLMDGEIFEIKPGVVKVL